MPYRPKHQIEVAWTQSKKRWKHRAVQAQGDQTHHDRHDLPIVVARFGRSKSPHPSALQIDFVFLSLFLKFAGRVRGVLVHGLDFFGVSTSDSSADY